MAEFGEWGLGRMAEPDAIVTALETLLGGDGLLKERQALVTSGPTHEAIDPARYLANRSSGKQGHAVAAVDPAGPPAGAGGEQDGDHRHHQNPWAAASLASYHQVSGKPSPFAAGAAGLPNLLQ